MRGVKGHLDFFRKFAWFGSVTLPLSPISCCSVIAFIRGVPSLGSVDQCAHYFFIQFACFFSPTTKIGWLEEFERWWCWWWWWWWWWWWQGGELGEGLNQSTCQKFSPGNQTFPPNHRRYHCQRQKHRHLLQQESPNSSTAHCMYIHCHGLRVLENKTMKA